MGLTIYARRILAVLFCTGLVVGGPQVVRAAATPSVRTFVASFSGQKAWVTVIRRGSSQPPFGEKSWWAWGNATTDEYLFSFGAPNRVRLALAFSRLGGGRLSARFYTNHLGIKLLKYRLRGNHLKVLSEHGHAYMIVETRHNGWIYKGKANYDVTVWIDGLSGLGIPKTAANGKMNAVDRVGQTVPGVPQWETSQLLDDPHKNWGYYRFGAQQRLPTAPPFKVTPSVMPEFPFFQIGNETKTDWYQVNPQPFFWDIPASQLLLNSFVGFENAGNYRINSKTSPPWVDFESPFGFYNFLPHSRTSQLVVRSESFPANDIFDGLAASHEARTSFRYSWAGSNPSLWDYSLQLAGTMPLNHMVTIGGVSFRSVGPLNLPSWVVGQSWPMVAFVQAMHGYAGSEGIYEYTPQIPQAWPWLLGTAAQPPDFWQHPYLSNLSGAALSNRGRHPGETLAVGFRGEYNAADFRKPALYISPVDGLVHLAWAQSGVWNLGHGWYLRTESLDKGPFFDAWTLHHLNKVGPNTRAEGGKIASALYDFGHYVIYQGRSGVVVRRTGVDPRPVVLTPPTDAFNWRAFVRATASATTGNSPWTMAAWLRAFPGRTLHLGASISDVSFTGHRYRMLLSLKQSFSGKHVLRGLAGLKAGDYWLTYAPSAGRWTASVAKPGPLQTRAQFSTGIVGQPDPVLLRMTNEGNMPRNVVADVLVGGRLKGTTRIQVSGLHTMRLTLPWIPITAGLTSMAVKVNGVVVGRGTIDVRAPSRMRFFVKSLPGWNDQWVVGLTIALLLLFVGMAWYGNTRMDWRIRVKAEDGTGEQK